MDPQLAPEKYQSEWIQRSSALSSKVRQTIGKIDILLYPGRDIVELDAYIGFRHVNGVLEWPAQEKARFIIEMVQRHAWSYKEIAKRIGTHGRHVERHYITARAIEQAVDAEIEGAENIDMGVFLRALQAGGISEFLGITYPGEPKKSEKPVPRSKMEDFRLFVWSTFGSKRREKVLPESRALTKWGRILQSSGAVRYLKNAAQPNFERAWAKSGGQQESLVDLVNAAADNLEDALPLIPDFLNDREVIDAIDRCARRLKQILRDYKSIEKKNFSNA